MNPALLIASFVLGLFVPAILKSDLPRDLPPNAVVIDNMARLGAFVVAVGLLVFVAAVEIGDDQWSIQNLSIAVLLAAWTLALLSGAFVVLGWHRLHISLGGATTPAWPTPGISKGLHAFTTVFALTISGCMVLVAMYYSDESSDALPGWVIFGAFIAWATMLGFAWVLHRVQIFQESNLPTARGLAKALASADGAWRPATIGAIDDPATVSVAASIWIQDGRWFWRTTDISQLVKFRRAAAVRATRPSAQLHVHRLRFSQTLGTKRNRPRGKFGVHVDDGSRRWPQSRRPVTPFTADDFGPLPEAAWGYLVPLDQPTLDYVGLQVSFDDEPAPAQR